MIKAQSKQANKTVETNQQALFAEPNKETKRRAK